MKNKKNTLVAIGCWTILIGVIMVIGYFLFGSSSEDNLEPLYSHDSVDYNTEVVEVDWDAIIVKYKSDLTQNETNLESLRTFDTTLDNLNAQIIILDDAQRFYKKLLSEDTVKVVLKKDIEDYKNDLIKTQKIIYPKIRKIFTEKSKKQMWEHDIKVYSSGTTINFVGYTFAKNKNIKDSYESIAVTLKEMRFKRVNFKWSEGDEYTFYSISSPNDSEIE